MRILKRPRGRIRISEERRAGCDPIGGRVRHIIVIQSVVAGTSQEHFHPSLLLGARHSCDYSTVCLWWSTHESKSRRSSNHGALSPTFTMGISPAWMIRRNAQGESDKYSLACFSRTSRRALVCTLVMFHEGTPRNQYPVGSFGGAPDSQLLRVASQSLGTTSASCASPGNTD